jgi:hypothetical protein
MSSIIKINTKILLFLSSLIVAFVIIWIVVDFWIAEEIWMGVLLGLFGFGVMGYILYRTFRRNKI